MRKEDSVFFSRKAAKENGSSGQQACKYCEDSVFARLLSVHEDVTTFGRCVATRFPAIDVGEDRPMVLRTLAAALAVSSKTSRAKLVSFLKRPSASL